ncbi:hypothetical protein [Streptomyces sp. NPDC093589]|uniref:hypothetical protein n=1 Tax=Streptomyces sp. NPDC093589 TaxID=3366043 RepID=UPI003813CCC1
MPKPMTAADHFLAGEKLLDASSVIPSATDVARAQAHFTAARLLLDADALRHAPAALGRTGMGEVTDQRFRALQYTD